MEGVAIERKQRSDMVAAPGEDEDGRGGGLPGARTPPGSTVQEIGGGTTPLRTTIPPYSRRSPVTTIA
jgi:hypothetical protein